MGRNDQGEEPRVPNKEFKDWLADELASRKMLPFHLAKRMGVHASTVLSALSGEKAPRPETLQAIARALELPEVVVFQAAGILTEPLPDLNSHPLKATIAREVGNEDDPYVLAKMLELIRIARGLGGSDRDQGKKASKVRKLPLAE